MFSIKGILKLDKYDSWIFFLGLLFIGSSIYKNTSSVLPSAICFIFSGIIFNVANNFYLESIPYLSEQSEDFEQNKKSIKVHNREKFIKITLQLIGWLTFLAGSILLFFKFNAINLFSG